MGGKKVGRGARWLRALPSAEGGEGCCGGGAMVVIACSTCLNSSHIHLGPSFTLNCFYNPPQSLDVSHNIFENLHFHKIFTECLKAAVGRPSSVHRK